MDYRLLIARRYLFSPRRITLISIITGISVFGVALGVAALIIVLSVMNGFSDVVRGLLVGLDPHVRIVATDSAESLVPDSLMDVALTVPHVESAAAYVQGKALLVIDGIGEMNRVVIVRGMDTESAGKVSDVVEKTTLGTFDLERRAGRAGIVLGRNLGQALNAYPPAKAEGLPSSGDERGTSVYLLTASGIERMMTQLLGAMPFSPFEVRGLYEMEPVYDETHVFIGLAEAQRLFRMNGTVSGIELRLDDLDRAAEVKEQLIARLDTSRVEVMTWYDLKKSLYEVMELEKWGASLVLFLIVIVAAFNIVGSLTMVVIEKRHDIGVLKAMGVSARNVLRIFLLEGALIGAIGTGVGLVFGLGLALAQLYFDIVPMAEAESFILDAYPIAIRGFDIGLIVVVALGLCIAAAIYPSVRAASIEPADAVRIGD
ncbi:MAG: FtsX-like permease family protein [Rhodothermales bacterium]